MPTFTITRGLNVRRYFDASIEADTPEQAFAIGQAMILSDKSDGWTPSKFGHAPRNDLTEPVTGANESLSVVDETGEVMIDFSEVPNADEPAGYSALLNFARQVANLETWEDRIKRESEEDGITDAEEIEELRHSADKDLDYLEAQDETLEKLTALARALLAFPKPDDADAELRAACEAAGWREGAGYIYDSNVYGSWKEAVSWTGEDGKASPVYETWSACYAAEFAR